jgi:hypothetical protein
LWPYVVGVNVKDGVEAPDNIEELRAVYAGIVEERRRRACGAGVRVERDEVLNVELT